MKRTVLGLVALLTLSAAGLAAIPAEAQGISQKVAPCDWSYPTRCASISASGSMTVSGNIITITSAPTVSTSAYATGDVMGTKMTLANAVRAAGGSGLLQEVSISFKGTQTTPVDLFFCNADPSGSTFTDNAAVNVVAADFAKCRAVHITDCTSQGTPTVCRTGNIAMPFTITGSTSAYAFLVVRGTPTLTATDALSVSATILRN